MRHPWRWRKIDGLNVCEKTADWYLERRISKELESFIAKTKPRLSSKMQIQDPSLKLEHLRRLLLASMITTNQLFQRGFSRGEGRNYSSVNNFAGDRWALPARLRYRRERVNGTKKEKLIEARVDRAIQDRGWLLVLSLARISSEFFRSRKVTARAPRFAPAPIVLLRMSMYVS